MAEAKTVLKGVIAGFVYGRDAYPKYAIVRFEGVRTYAEAAKLIGKRVIWKSKTGKLFVGKVVRVLGKRGAVVVRFRKALPGQAIGTIVDLTE